MYGLCLYAISYLFCSLKNWNFSICHKPSKRCLSSKLILCKGIFISYLKSRQVEILDLIPGQMLVAEVLGFA